VTVYSTLLARGYFPKELPPGFFTESFAKYAATKDGRSTISTYSPTDNFTECLKYRLALPGLDRRELRIPHPASFAKLSELTAKNFGRLLKKASGSDFSRSRPIYAVGRQRAIQPMVHPGNLARERAAIRAGASYLLKTDISQFYPSLYTHAVGWSVDPKLRKRANWNNRKLLGKMLDQALMDLDGKVSQGVPIGNDISFLLAEIVLAEVDKRTRLPAGRAYRWFDDYEIAFDTSDQAEEALKRLNKELGRFRLRLNARKTSITRLPHPAQEEWQEMLRQAGGHVRFWTPGEMVRYFDAAFRLRDQFSGEPVLLYALGLLFRIGRPAPDVARIAQSCITQSLLCEPGAAQEAFALLAFWRLNGLALDAQLVTNTINQMVARHHASGLSSDIAWALAFCLEQGYALDSRAAQVLSSLDDDCIALQALHMEKEGLLPKGFNKKRLIRALKDADLDRDHWLIAYESVRHGFLKVCMPAVKSSPFFSNLLKHRVTFYRTTLPSYASVIHPGGAPEWVVRKWMSYLTGKAPSGAGPSAQRPEETPVLKLIGEDLAKISHTPSSSDDAVTTLMDAFVSEAAMAREDTYFV
jgi:hypothetical protein